MADTLSAQIQESTQEIIDATQLMMPQYSPMLQLCTKRTIPKGRNALEIPYVATFPTVETPAEGDELVNTSTFDLQSTTINPVFRVIRTRIHYRAERFSQDELISIISEWIARAQAVNSDIDLIAEFANFNTANDVGQTNINLTLSTLRTARRLLRQVPSASGGPAPGPVFTVLSPMAAEDLLADMGVTGVVSSNPPWIPAGLSEKLIREYMVEANFQLLNTAVFWDSNISNDSNGDHICGMFSQKALFHAMSRDWKLETFPAESNYPGIVLRSIADFDSGVHGYSSWGAQITADGT